MAKNLHIKNRERKINIQFGVTINTGNYSTIRLDIGEEFWIDESQDLETEYIAHLEKLKQIIRNEETKRREALKPKAKPPAEPIVETPEEENANPISPTCEEEDPNGWKNCQDN